MATKEVTTVTVEMKIDKVTKGTVRYAEVLESEMDEARLPTVYVPKATVRELGQPEVISVTVTSA